MMKRKVKYEEKNNNLIVIRKKGGCSLLTNLNVKQKIFTQILSSKYYNKKKYFRMKSISNNFTRKKRNEKLINTKVGSRRRTYIDKTDEHYYYS